MLATSTRIEAGAPLRVHVMVVLLKLTGGTVAVATAAVVLEGAGADAFDAQAAHASARVRTSAMRASVVTGP